MILYWFGITYAKFLCPVLQIIVMLSQGSHNLLDQTLAALVPNPNHAAGGHTDPRIKQVSPPTAPRDQCSYMYIEMYVHTC